MAVTRMNKHVLLFDLGGVVVPWVGLDALSKNHGLTRDAVIAKLSASEIFHAYEIGACDDETFLEEMIELFNMNISPENFASMWNSWVHPPFHNTLETLAALKSKYIIACLSNTNALHWEHLKAMFNLSDIFDYAFASHEISAAKPDDESYIIPLKSMGVLAADVTFFDDTLMNVEAAQKLGITAHHVDRTVGVLPTLTKLGII
ncbi:HAD superfamily hydrolase (TIGR01509 family) [Litorimonas taeanensis]|uniref:HAD superfamily hydrolase (TIGR01509 family) n=2 Tax=Litorimonas taeanensis TaxID=568099 RepID=A0A420WFJ3_9PROT|nr:HAD superfamily hydrolase (TIGR01509 family) [Litorimonas taeanensis]